MLNILLTGSTGQVGSKIIKLLEKNSNYRLFLPVRNNKNTNTHNKKYYYYDMNEIRYFKFFDKIDIFIHAATAWKEDSIKVNVDSFKFILDNLNKERIKRIIILSSASVIKKNKINPDSLTYGTDYIKSKYLQFKMIENHELKNKCVFLFLTMVIDHSDRINQIPFIYKYGKYFPRNLPDHSFHMIRSEDIALVCLEIINYKNPKFINIVGLPKTNLTKFLKVNNIVNNGFISFYIIRFFINIFADSWTYYNINYFLDQSYQVINPETFNKKILFNYSDLINKPNITIVIFPSKNKIILRELIKKINKQIKINYNKIEIILISDNKNINNIKFLKNYEQLDLKVYSTKYANNLKSISKGRIILKINLDIFIKDKLYLDNLIKDYRYNYPKMDSRKIIIQSDNKFIFYMFILLVLIILIIFFLLNIYKYLL